MSIKTYIEFGEEIHARIEEAQHGEFSTQDFDGIIAKAKKKWRNASK
jgi:hypothetical protein